MLSHIESQIPITAGLGWDLVIPLFSCWSSHSVATWAILDGTTVIMESSHLNPNASSEDECTTHMIVYILWFFLHLLKAFSVLEAEAKEMDLTTKTSFQNTSLSETNSSLCSSLDIYHIWAHELDENKANDDSSNQMTISKTLNAYFYHSRMQVRQ